MRNTLLPALVLLSGCTTTFDPNTPVRCLPESASSAPAPEKHVTITGPHPWAAEEANIPSATLHLPGDLFAELPTSADWGHTIKLANAAVGYLDGVNRGGGTRAVVTREGIRKVAEPKELTQFCTSDNGSATFFVQRDRTVHQADSFDGPARVVGKHITYYGDDFHKGFMMVDKSTLLYVNCKTGTTERVTTYETEGSYSSVEIVHRNDIATVIRDTRQNKQTCYLRLASSSNWEEIANCTSAQTNGQFVRFFVQSTDKKKDRPTQCSFALDPTGKKIACNDVPPQQPRSQPAQREEYYYFGRARFVGKTKIAVPSDRGLYILPVQGTRADAKQLVKGKCEPLLSVAPVFRCVDEKTRVVSVNIEGTLKQEIDVPKIPDGTERGFFSSTDGGLAIGGDCDGSMGDAACVRQPDGTWKTISFAADLVSALHRTAPGTLLVPAANGDLFVGTGTSDGLLSGGPVSILVYKADKGLATRIEKVPTWILGDMAGLGGIISTLLGGHSMREGPSLVWRSADVLSAWPLSRKHPAFGTPESCRFDIALNGATDANCVQGKVIAEGRFGLWEKKNGTLLETRDAGQTWTQVALPEGTDTQNITCSAIGCWIWPYFRLGWGN